MGRHDRLEWRAPTTEEFGSAHAWHWDSACGRYRVHRIVSKSREAVAFAASYNDPTASQKMRWMACETTMTNGFSPRYYGSLRAAFDAAEAFHCRRAGTDGVASNKEVVLATAGTLAHAQAEGALPAVRHQPGRAGIGACIVSMLRAASPEHPVSREQIHAELCRRLPDRDPRAMKVTVVDAVPNRLRRKGVAVKGDLKGGFWLDSLLHKDNAPDNRERKRTQSPAGGRSVSESATVTRVSRQDVLSLVEALGFKLWAKYDNKKLAGKLRKAGEVVDDANRSKLTDEQCCLLDTILAAGDAIEIDGDDEPAVKDKPKEKAKKKEKPAAKPKEKAKDKPKVKPKEKAKEPDPSKQKVGVIAFFVSLLKKASRKKPATKPDLLDALCAQFPERERDKMKVTLYSELPLRLRRKGLDVKDDGQGGFWIE